MYEIFKSGYSRIPVFDSDPDDIIGLILAKDLIFVDAEVCLHTPHSLILSDSVVLMTHFYCLSQDETPVRNFIELFGRKPAVVWHDDKLGETLSKFKAERAHMAIVRDVVSEGTVSALPTCMCPQLMIADFLSLFSLFAAQGDPVYAVVGIITLEDIIEEILGTEIVDETDNMAESELFKSPQFRDMDFARLKLLHNKNRSDAAAGLSPDEVRAVVAHLSANVSQIQHLFQGDAAALTELVKRSEVMTVKRKTAAGAKPCQEDMLYRRGKVSSMCTLVLSGQLTVLAGKDEFQSEKGPWSTLAADALTVTEGTYIPDYSAFIASESIRFVSLSMSVQNTIREGGGADKEHSGSFSQQLSGGHRRKSATRNASFHGSHSLTERKYKQQRQNNLSTDGSGLEGSGNPLLLAALLGARDSPVTGARTHSNDLQSMLSRQSTLDSSDCDLTPTPHHPPQQQRLSVTSALFPAAPSADDDYHLYQDSGSEKREAAAASATKKKLRFHDDDGAALPGDEV